MKYTLFLILAFIVSALLSPISFGIELSKSIEMPEYKSGVSILLVGDQQTVDYASINAIIRGNLDKYYIAKTGPSFIRLNTKPWIISLNYKEAAVLTSKAELAGVSQNINNIYLPRMFT